MKTKIVAILEPPFKGKKEGAGMVKVCVLYPDNNSGVHLIYAKNIADLVLLKVGDVVDLQVKMEEMCFLNQAA